MQSQQLVSDPFEHRIVVEDDLGQSCSETVLVWGDALRAARNQPKNKLFQEIARRHSERVLHLALDVSRAVYPEIVE